MEYTDNAKMLMGYISDDERNVENIMDFSDSSSDETLENVKSEGQNYPETKQEKISWHEQIRMMQLRSHINQLLDEVKQAQYIADKTREELKKCKLQIKIFENERDKVFAEIKAKETENNRSAVDRLCATHERICRELEAEQKLEVIIAEKLDLAEYELARAELERGKFLLAEDDLLQREFQLSQEKAEMSMLRQQKEELFAKQTLAKKQKDKNLKNKAILAAEKRHRHTLEEAEKSHNRANKYLSKTMAKLKQRQDEEAERYKADMSKKMDMLLKLRDDIAHTKENLRAVKARDKVVEEKKKLEECLERDRVLSEGGNFDHTLLVKKRKEDMEKLKQQFNANQEEKRVEIVKKIIREEENLKKKKKLQPYLWEWPDREKILRVPPRKPKIPKMLKDYMASSELNPPVNEIVEEKPQIKPKNIAEIRESISLNSLDVSSFSSNPKQKGSLTLPKKTPLPNISATEPDCNQNLNRSAVFEEDIISFDKNEEDSILAISEGESEEEEMEEHLDYAFVEEHEEEGIMNSGHLEKSDSESFSEEEEPQVDLARPEFEGLWNKETKSHKKIKTNDQPQLGHPGMSKLDKEILQKTLEKTKKSIVTTQIAAGKEFKGPAFYSKPDVIHFKDLEVGKTYKKKVKITNVSYTLNYIKFIDISDKLKDFISIQFNPPGAMSAGLTCELVATFKPMINEDLAGSVNFLTQTGPFEIPLICSTKKCNLSVDYDTLDFGTHVIGEILKKTIVLKNNGALGANFEFSRVHFFAMEKKSIIQEQTPVPHARHSEAPVHESPSPANVLERVSEAMEASQSDVQLQTPTKLSSQKMSETFNPLSQRTSSEKALQPGTNSMHHLTLSASGLLDGASNTKVPSSGLNSVDPKSHDLESAPNENIEIFEAVSTRVDTPFKKCVDSMQSSEEDGMSVGNVTSNQLGPYSAVKLDIVWKPVLPGDVKVEFEIKFSDQENQPITIVAVGKAIDVPIWVERSIVDLQICMFDRLYQDTLIVCNKESNAKSLRFELPPELKDHMEILPKTGYIQALSQFSAQLKFLPRKSIYKDAPTYVDEDIGTIEVPVTIRVSDQLTPVMFTVQAIVTSTDIELSESSINFGYCTIHQSKKKKIELTNKCLLSQQFGFVGLPEWLSVQPNDGFGTLLPLETLTLDVIFSPKKADDYRCELVCRTLINRDFNISCTGTGVHPPLELSKQVVHFCATSLYDKSRTFIHVINNHTSANEFTHPVPRIGKGKVCSVGPTSFQFIVPKDAPFSIDPCVGTLQPGKKCKVNVQFLPVLNDEEIREEALIILEKEKMKEEKITKETLEATVIPSGMRKKFAKINDIKSDTLSVIESSTETSNRRNTNTHALEVYPSNNYMKIDTFEGISPLKNETNSHKANFFRNNTQRKIAPLGNECKENMRRDLLKNRNVNANSADETDGNEEAEVNQSQLYSTADLQDDEEAYDTEQDNVAQATSNKSVGKEKSTSNLISQSKLKMSGSTLSVAPEVTKEKLDPEQISKNSSEYKAATATLIRQFRSKFKSFTIPCYVAFGQADVPGKLEYNVHNTLFLQVHCPTVQPPIMVISDDGNHTIDFGNVSLGQTCRKSVTILNISDQDVVLKSTLLNPAGPFLILNALRPLSQGATHTILMSFTPEKNQMFQETLGIKSGNSTLYLTLKGYGVSPLVKLSFSESVFDMGAVLSGEYIEKLFKIENTSILAINYIIKQGSLSSDPVHKAEINPEIHKDKRKAKQFVGTQNYNGRNVFDLIPVRGTIPGGASQEVTVTFAPDHESDNYSDGISVELFDEKGSHFFRLIGQGKSRMMFIEGYDQLLPRQESLALSPYYPEDDDADGKSNLPPPAPALITIKSLMLNDTFQPGSHTIYVGCVRTMAVSQKKNGEFSVDGIQNLIQKGFAIEPQKGMVEAGIKKPVVFTWTPPANHDPNVTVEETTTLTLKCDGTEQITLIIQASVITG